jgi:hypothetical protein
VCPSTSLASTSSRALTLCAGHRPVRRVLSRAAKFLPTHASPLKTVRLPYRSPRTRCVSLTSRARALPPASRMCHATPARGPIARRMLLSLSAIFLSTPMKRAPRIPTIKPATGLCSHQTAHCAPLSPSRGLTSVRQSSASTFSACFQAFPPKTHCFSTASSTLASLCQPCPLSAKPSSRPLQARLFDSHLTAPAFTQASPWCSRSSLACLPPSTRLPNASPRTAHFPPQSPRPPSSRPTLPTARTMPASSVFGSCEPRRVCAPLSPFPALRSNPTLTISPSASPTSLSRRRWMPRRRPSGSASCLWVQPSPLPPLLPASLF